jgi:hypothetical protein
MEQIKKWLVVLGVGLFIYLLYPYFNQPVVVPPVTDTRPLQPNEKERVVIRKGQVTKVTKEGVKTIYVPPQGKTEITIDKRGEVTVNTKTHGFCREFGLLLGYSRKPVGAIDCKFAFWNRLGLSAGLGATVESRPLILGFGGITYTFSNTSLFVGINTSKDLIVGVRVGF